MTEIQNEQNVQTSNNTPVDENQSNDEKKKFAMFGMGYSIVGLILIIISLIISNILLLIFGFISLSVGFIFFIVWGFRKLKDNNQYKNKHNKGIFITSTIYYIIGSIFIIFSWLFIRTGGVGTCLCVGFILLLIGFILRKIGLSHHFSKKSGILVIIFGILFILFILYGVNFIFNRSFNSKCFNYGSWVINGKKIVFYKDRPRQLLFEGNCKNGWEDGKWTEYRRNGQIDREGYYKDGIEIGKWTYYNYDGSIKREYEY